jgi:hypothetical protein
LAIRDITPMNGQPNSAAAELMQMAVRPFEDAVAMRLSVYTLEAFLARERERKTSALISIYPSHLITLTPGYFWYLSLQPVAVGKVHMIYGGGSSPEFMADAKASEYNETLKSLLAVVNVEDRTCTEAVYRGLCAGLSKPGHLSHRERPIYVFARYLASRTG